MAAQLLQPGSGGNGGTCCLNSLLMLALLCMALVTLLSSCSSKEIVTGLPVLLYVDPGVGNCTLTLLGGVSGMLVMSSAGGEATEVQTFGVLVLSCCCCAETSVASAASAMVGVSFSSVGSGSPVQGLKGLQASSPGGVQVSPGGVELTILQVNPGGGGVEFANKVPFLGMLGRGGE